MTSEFSSADLSLAAGVTTLAGDLCGVFVVLAIGAAILFGGHAATGWMRAFLSFRHMGIPSELQKCVVLELGCMDRMADGRPRL